MLNLLIELIGLLALGAGLALALGWLPALLIVVGAVLVYVANLRERSGARR